MNQASAAEALLFAALEKPTAAERIAFLDSACAGDTELRRQVEKLLKAHANAGDFLNKPVGELLAAASEPSDAAQALDGSTDRGGGNLERTEGEGVSDDPDGALDYLLTQHLASMPHPGNVNPHQLATPAAPVQAAPPSRETTDATSAGRRPGFQARRWVAAAAGLLTLLSGLGFAEATGVSNVGSTVVRPFLPEGTLEIQIDDPATRVQIDGSDLVISGAGAKEIRLKPGRYTVEARKDGKLVRRELVNVTRNGRQVVRVYQEPSKTVAPIEEAGPPKKAPDFINSIGMEFVLLPTARFWMGGGGGKSGVKDMAIPYDFYLGRYEVTQDEWEKVMKTNPSEFQRTGVERNKVMDIDEKVCQRVERSWQGFV